MSDLDALGGMTAEDQTYFATGGGADAAPAPAPASEPAQQQGEADASQEQPEAAQQEEKKFIPLSELAKERERRRELQQRIENERVERARLEERLNILAQRLEQPRQEEPPPPSFDEDPAGYLRYQAERTGQTVEQLQRQLAEREQHEQQQAQQRQFLGTYQQQAAQFAQQNPDFRDAYTHWLTNLRDELVDAGVTDQQAIIAELRTFEANIVRKAMQDGVNPAERLYKLAQRRGYKRAEAAPHAVDKVETIAKGQQAARSLSSASGAAPRGAPSLEALATMSDDEFSEMTSGSKWEKLFG